MTATIDTLSIADRLAAAGASKELAREHAEILREAVDDSLVSKSDLRDEIQKLELRLKLFVLVSQIGAVAILGTMMGVFKFIL